MKKSKFGKPSLNHTFTSEGKHILIFLFKGGCLLKQDKTNLLITHPLFKHFDTMLNWSNKINFIDIKEPIKDYANQKSINTIRVQKMLVAVFWYNLDIPTVIRFLRNNYIGEYKETDITLKLLNDTKCDPQVIKDIERLFHTEVPNKFNASSTHKNYLDFFRYGNHSSILKDIDKTLKAMNKEDRNQFLIPLPSWIARFIRNSHLTPQGLLTKPGKTYRFICDGSFIPKWDSTSINMMLSHETEPKIVYSDAFTRHLKIIWNLRITHSKTDFFF